MLKVGLMAVGVPLWGIKGIVTIAEVLKLKSMKANTKLRVSMKWARTA